MGFDALSEATVLIFGILDAGIFLVSKIDLFVALHLSKSSKFNPGKKVHFLDKFPHFCHFFDKFCQKNTESSCHVFEKPSLYDTYFLPKKGQICPKFPQNGQKVPQSKIFVTFSAFFAKKGHFFMVHFALIYGKKKWKTIYSRVIFLYKNVSRSKGFSGRSFKEMRGRYTTSAKNHRKSRKS